MTIRLSLLAGAALIIPAALLAQVPPPWVYPPAAYPQPDYPVIPPPPPEPAYTYPQPAYPVMPPPSVVAQQAPPEPGYVYPQPAYPVVSPPTPVIAQQRPPEPGYVYPQPAYPVVSPAPPVVAEQARPVLLEQDPPVAEQAAPTALAEQAPPVAVERSSPVVEQAPTVLAEQEAPTVLAEQAPPVVVEQAPTALAEQAPPVVVERSSPVVEQAPTVLVEQAAPTVLAEQVPPVAVEQAPTALAEQAPPVAVERSSPVVEQAPTVLVEQAAPTVLAEQVPPVAVEQAPAFLAEQEAPTVLVEQEPPAVEQAPLAATEQAPPTAFVPAAPAPMGQTALVISEPWMAPAGVGGPQPQWQSPNAPTGKSAALEPIDLPPAIEQGVDMIYIDQELVPSAVQDQSLLHQMSFGDFSGAPVDLFVPVNPIYTELRRGLVRYRQNWGNLPQVPIPGGPALKPASTGERVAALRGRLGLSAGDTYDDALAQRVKAFQAVHGLKDDGIAGGGTIDALNRGPSHYERLIIINMERAKRLPAPQEQGKYAIVDAGNARLSLWENGRMVDSMKVVVGKAETATPMMAAYIRYASVNPYWNVPPELVQNLIAPRIVEQGTTYLSEREYQVLTSYGQDAKLIDPETVDWKAVVAGRQQVSLRRLPSPANSMGMMKFMLPNYFGIYLHDSPEKAYFEKGELWVSNGCVRVEDYKRFARWLFEGPVPEGSNPKVEEAVELPRPVPVYMTYLTVQPTATGVRFVADHYGRDAALLERYGTQLAAAVRRGN